MSYLVVSGKGDADVDRLTAMARALCRELPRLRKQGDPIWRELQPSAQIDTGWPVVRPFQSALSDCSAPAATQASTSARSRARSSRARSG